MSDENRQPIQLVVPRDGEDTLSHQEQAESCMTCRWKKCSMAAWRAKTIGSHRPHWLMPGPARQIYGLQPAKSPELGDYEYNYCRAVGEEQAEAAVAAARLDYHASFAAACIFVGKEISTIRISSTLSRSALLEGTNPNRARRSPW